MDRITHQPPRQQGYGSTSSLRNDSLKHTRKHERRKEGIEPKSKTARLWRTVLPGEADCPHGPRGLSGLLPRTVRTRTADRPALSRGLPVKANRTSSSEPRKTDRPWGARGLSARHPRTVRPAHEDRLKPRPTKTRNHNGLKTRASKNMKNTRRPSATRSRTVRALRTEQKTARPRRSTPPIHHRISQKVEAVETRVWGHEKRQPRKLYPKNFAS
jgi:hypothetical protein